MLDSLVRLLAHDPLQPFLVTALCGPLGRATIRGGQAGVAAVHLVGLGAGALSPSLALPESVHAPAQSLS